ncbi:GerAB/ArcD/ProY family transporter [Paenibacillus cremeus]|uniref:GerAB/ArcD/ProY family transporter n=1 Tax=Paenibacillus cremeus TaxID=2163881 RepID=A0A559JGH8_9BACL|nr:GerAB/ArcD/ProY family transporter [Paenibacillus cremeus]TVX98977.1 GerAB/ArcD/ProY family transporter [Paenibacillus cremeus]
MNRYFYYPIAMCMLMNTIIFVPNILLARKEKGALLGMLLSLIIGPLLGYIFTKSFSRFKKKGLPEVLSQFVPKYVMVPVLAYLSCMWFAAGSIVIVTYTLVIKRYIMPDMPQELLLLFFMAAVCYCALKPTRTVLYLLEVILMISVPLIVIILVKAVSNEYLSWYAIWNVASDYVFTVPNTDVMSAATYIFSGYLNLVVFNKELGGQFTLKQFWAVPILGFGVLMTSFFIPIGFHGTIGIDNYVYSWISTADSMRSEFGFVERVMYLFLLLYLNLSLIFTTVSWHVGYQLANSLFAKRGLIGYVLLGLMIMITIGLIHYFSEKDFLTIGTKWLNVRLYSEVLLVMFIYYLSRKGKPI